MPASTSATYAPTNVVANASTPEPSPTPTITRKPYQGPVAGFGDSIMLGGAPCLEPRGYSIDAVQGRSFESGWAALQGATDLPKRIVIGLGTNGPFSEDAFDAVMAHLGRRQVYWVNVHLPDEDRYAFANGLNGMLARKAAQYPNAHIVDWDLRADEHPQWLYDDHTHLRPTTCEIYAEIIDAAVRAPR